MTLTLGQPLTLVLSGGSKMEYTISQLGEISGVTNRTLRYYDQIGLLKPKKINKSGYRIYGETEIDMLQQILFYRELELSLEEIKKIINDDNFDQEKALSHHYISLMEKRNHLDKIIATVEKTLANHKGEINMSNHEKFEAFKEQQIEKNEERYGQEIREKYGEETVRESNKQFKNMSESDYQEFQSLEQEIIDHLIKLTPSKDPSTEEAQELAAMHKEWLSFTWPNYSPEAHAGLVEMYVADERFKSYYDKHVENGAEFLKEAVLIYTGMK